MNNNALLILVALGAVLVLKKKAASSTPAATSPVATNVNNQLWNSILGSSWQSLVGGASGFLMRNDNGQVVTSDGKPVNSALPAISAALSNTDYSSGYTGVSDSVSTAAPDGTDLLSTLAW